jgi:uncharacterized protein YhhL (DUF1145 family)
MIYEDILLSKFNFFVKLNIALPYQVELRTGLSILKTFLVVAKYSVSNNHKYP